jgi:hypothetical protein
VEKGGSFLFEPMSLPEETVIDLLADDECDDLTDPERRALCAARCAFSVMENRPTPVISPSGDDSR